MVHSIPTIKTAPIVLLRVSAAATPLVPTSIPSPESFSTLATFDALDGKFYHCLLPSMKDLPPLDAMRVPAGVMVVCQPLPTLVSPFTDNRASGLGAGNLYTDRTSDKVVIQYKIDSGEHAEHKAVPAPVKTLG